MALFIPEANPCVTAGIRLRWMPLELASHAQMNAPYPVAGSRLRLVQLRHEVFPSTAPMPHFLPLQSKTKSMGSPWTGDCPITEDINVVNDKRLKTARQSPANRLYFREFRQRTQAGSSSDSAKLFVLMPPSEPEMPL